MTYVLHILFSPGEDHSARSREIPTSPVRLGVVQLLPLQPDRVPFCNPYQEKASRRAASLIGHDGKAGPDMPWNRAAFKG